VRLFFLKTLLLSFRKPLSKHKKIIYNKLIYHAMSV